MLGLKQNADEETPEDVDRKRKPTLRKRALKRIRRTAFVAGLGAVAAYFFDPDRGAARRAAAKDRIDGLKQKMQGSGEPAESGLQPEAYGMPGVGHLPAAPAPTLRESLGKTR